MNLKSLIFLRKDEAFLIAQFLSYYVDIRY